MRKEEVMKLFPSKISEVSEEIIFQNPFGLVAEYGSESNVRFLDANQVTMEDAEGNVILCKCGKPATEFIIGIEAYLGRCSECMQEQYGSAPVSDVKFIFKEGTTHDA